MCPACPEPGHCRPDSGTAGQRRVGCGGRPASRTTTAGKAQLPPPTREALRARGIGSTSPERADQIARRGANGSAGDPPLAFDPEVHAGRNIAERCFARFKQFRGLATRYAQRAA